MACRGDGGETITRLAQLPAYLDKREILRTECF
jgi:hypothetical protein